jgi:hypothetical protein
MIVPQHDSLMTLFHTPLMPLFHDHCGAGVFPSWCALIVGKYRRLLSLKSRSLFFDRSSLGMSGAVRAIQEEAKDVASGGEFREEATGLAAGERAGFNEFLSVAIDTRPQQIQVGVQQGRGVTLHQHLNQLGRTQRLKVNLSRHTF